MNQKYIFWYNFYRQILEPPGSRSAHFVVVTEMDPESDWLPRNIFFVG